MSLAGIAKDTLAIIERGHYRAPSGRTVELRDLVERSLRSTVLYEPADLEALGIGAAPMHAPAGAATTAPGLRIEVRAETTGAAARRLAQTEGRSHVVALNFASAKNPGGGFLGGARAQEEDLARCSALYATQLTQPGYYSANRAEPSMLYTDHLIYSPAVPFFRDDRLELLEQPYCAAVITSPAPNAGEVLRRDPGACGAIHATLVRRARHVLDVCAAQGHRHLVLGAWGCGVFRNDPAEVAEVFAAWLASPRFAGAFEQVVFAVYDRTPERGTLAAFKRRFAA